MHTSPKPRMPGSSTADIITYRYNGELMYVPVVPNYNQAISHARDAFPQLKHATVSLSLTVPGQERKLVGISAPAWPKLIAHMSRYQIIDVHTAPVQDGGAPGLIPEITITRADTVDDVKELDPAPPYQGPNTVDSEKSSYSRTRTISSTSTTSTKRSWLFQKLHGH